ncbi:MAG: Gfo/Idh/MocA family oxidoreductase [bacterium]
MKNMTVSRRSFLKGAGAAIAFPNIITSSALGAGGRPPASGRIVMAGIGMGGQGSGDLGQFMNDPRIQVVAVCDVKKQNLDGIKRRVNGHYNNQDCKGYVDYREVLARNDIDMILCATPDHWHAQISIDAMKSGKDVYCEKPLTLTIGEGRKMVDTARRYGRVLSSGSQRVIGDYGALACAARSGQYGKILDVYADPGGPPRQCDLPGEPIPPDTIDWDMWLGPAPWAPYHRFRCGPDYGLGGQGFRSWYDYSGGMMTDWGGHKFGAALHGMGLDHTGPTEILPPDGKDNKYLTYVFANGMKLHVGEGGPKYMCEKGEAHPLREFKVPPGLRWYEDGANSPIQDLVNCVISRKRPFQDVEYAHRTATVCHLGNICNKLNRKLQWDPVKEDFIGDPEASRLVDRPRRGPWQI